MEVTVKAYPKINLGLYVGSKRPDGFHNLISVFQKVDCFYDEITLCYKEGSSLEVSVSGLENIKNDTVTQAVMLFFEKAKKTGSLSVSVKKNIPQKSGMGGGSSDAASVLLCLNKILNSIFSFNELLALGLKIGSDVPFFLYETEAAIVTGRGEYVKPIKARQLSFSFEDSGYSKLSTGDAYKKLDEIIAEREMITEEELLEKYYSDVFDLKNDFALLYPPLQEGYSFTGSGSWCFCIKH